MANDEMIEFDDEFLEKLGIELADDDDLTDWDYELYLKERKEMYEQRIEDNIYHDHSPFLISDKSMRVVREYGIKTSLGNPIHLGDQLAGMVVSIPGFHEIPDATFYMLYKEDEVEEFGELVDSIWSDFVQNAAENRAVIWHDFYGFNYFMSMKKEYYEFLQNANNLNMSHNIFDYL